MGTVWGTSVPEVRATSALEPHCEFPNKDCRHQNIARLA